MVLQRLTPTLQLLRLSLPEWLSFCPSALHTPPPKRPASTSRSNFTVGARQRLADPEKLGLLDAGNSLSSFSPTEQRLSSLKS